jgi:hypothetical protein
MRGWQKIADFSQAFAPIVSVLVYLVVCDCGLTQFIARKWEAPIIQAPNVCMNTWGMLTGDRGNFSLAGNMLIGMARPEQTRRSSPTCTNRSE